MARKKPGRPKIMSPIAENALLQSFRHGLNVSEACTSAGIHRATFYRHIENSPEFEIQVGAAKTEAIIMARYTIVKEIEAGNLSVAKWYLSRKDPDFMSPSLRRRR
jgi:hypothetical protein